MLFLLGDTFITRNSRCCQFLQCPGSVASPPRVEVFLLGFDGRSFLLGTVCGAGRKHLPVSNRSPKIIKCKMLCRSSQQAKNGRTLNRPSGHTSVGLWLFVVCYLGEWQRTPLSLGGGQSNPTGKLRELFFALFCTFFWAAVGGGNSHRSAVYSCRTNCDFGPFPYMASRSFFFLS